MKERMKDFGREIFYAVTDAFENPYLLWMVVAIVFSIVYFCFSKEMTEDDYVQCYALVQEAASTSIIEVPQGYTLSRNNEVISARKSGIFYHGDVYTSLNDDNLVIKRDYSKLRLVTFSLAFGLVASWFLLLFICGFVLIAAIIYKAAENLFYDFISRRVERLN